MRAIICAAGRGKRIANLTEKYPKALLPLGDKRVIEHILLSLFENGIKKVTVVLGYEAETVMDFLKKNSHGCSLSFVINEDFENTDNLYSMFLAREHVTNGMLFLNGDTIFHSDILKNFLASGLDNAVVVDPVNTEAHPVLVHVSDKSIVEIGHDIEQLSHGSAFGIYKLSQSASERYFSIAEEMFRDAPQRGGFFMPLPKISEEIKIEPFFSDDPRWVNINIEKDYRNAQSIFGDKLL
ncbi:MAG: phosphocholine cytidylyltransferase family protein [Parcubacteria group bacterium]|nr:phosphocholine cytidylyltransferase family protein [Parcubacteria group bacterium]